MITLNIIVNETTWQASNQELKHLRSQVAYQKGIPVSQAFDVYDSKCVHFLAYDDQHTPVGCCRLMDNGRISRPQVPLEWQLKGVENKLIETAVKYAKTKTSLDELSILEDARIAPYYVHFGFKAEGTPITEHGLPAQMMKYQIKREDPKAHHSTVFYDEEIIQDIDQIHDFEGISSYQEALLQIANHSRRIIRIYSPTLPSEVFGDPRLLKIFSDHCRRSRFTSIQALILDEKDMISGTHGLRNLYEKIPSSISIRKLVPTDDEIDFREYMISDDGHMTIRARSRVIQGELSSNRAEIAKQITAFEEYWQKSKSIPDLRLTTY
ncbi:GNAT family N-acetyltransferase [Litoribrevibacter euphylliae]|uniref:GNAT family N-acetyltransferase n=1 Tax=Litoribrevibacter euphylliae TaxID=1834034 RepID=A0ABV7HGD5_9GAMM